MTTAPEEKNPVLNIEMMDRLERKALREKARQEAESATISKVEKTLARGKLGADKKRKKKTLSRWAGGILATAFLIWVGIYLFKPFKAGLPFGICKVFLETNVRYPQELRLSTVEDFGNSVRIWYTQIDAFGQYRMENIQCFYKADEKLGAMVEKITINRREVDPRKVDRFNKILPVILENPPDLTYPPPFSNSLEDLQIQTDDFRRKIF